MEVNITTKDIHYDFMDHLVEAFLTYKSHEIRTTPCHGIFPSFDLSQLEMGEYKFETEGEELVVIKNGEEIGRCSNDAYIFDWLIGLVIYIKQRNLVEDFKQFYCFYRAFKEKI